ncbi:hypothetical protein PC116_g33538 [Phytophthora cactorum]|nr:hypothetical protein PC116_g33538 [Phytophthora cactorum]
MSPDDDLFLNEARELLEEEDIENKQKSPTSPKSPLSQTSFPSDEPKRKEDKVWWTEEQNTSTKSEREIQKPTDAELEEAGKENASTAGTEGFDSETLRAILAEDESMMPLDPVNYVVSTQNDGNHDSVLTAQSSTETDRSDDQEGSTDSDSDSVSVSSLASSSSSVDGQWLLASTYIPSSSGGGGGGKYEENQSEKKSE